MSEKYFQINKKDLVSKFRDLVKKHAERGDDYNPKHGKISANHRDYFVLDKIRAIYNWAIGEIKLEIRRKYIHDDKKYKKVVGGLENYARNKIRSERDGTMYLKVNNQLTFKGDNKQYREHFVQSLSKQLSVFRKIVDELNSFLRDEELEDTNKPVLYDASPVMIRKEHSAEEIADIILKEVPIDYLLEINRSYTSSQNFDNFSSKICAIMQKYNIDDIETKYLLDTIKESEIINSPKKYMIKENNDESETDNTQTKNTEV